MSMKYLSTKLYISIFFNYILLNKLANLLIRRCNYKLFAKDIFLIDVLFVTWPAIRPNAAQEAAIKNMMMMR